MTKNQEINFTSSQDRKSKSTKYRKGMPTIRWVYGLKILIVPDLNAITRAEKNHLDEHKQADYGIALDSLEEFLTEQILKAASKMYLPNVS